jgi:RNA polymerase sigma-70 factor (ECF subfamily)
MHPDEPAAGLVRRTRVSAHGQAFFGQTALVPAAPDEEPQPAGADARELMRRLTAGDMEALGEIYDMYGVRCYSLARRLLGEQALAEDAVQEAMLALWRAPERFNAERGSLATFLLTLTHRRAIDVLRREAHQRRGRVATDEHLALLPSADAGTDEQAQARIEGARVRQALAQLPEAQREALLLAYFQGYTQREIASITDTPLGTVKTRMLAGVRALRAHLGPRLSAHGGTP